LKMTQASSAIDRRAGGRKGGETGEIGKKKNRTERERRVIHKKEKKIACPKKGVIRGGGRVETTMGNILRRDNALKLIKKEWS